MNLGSTFRRGVLLACATLMLGPGALRAQQPKQIEHPKVCSSGVKDYYSRSELPSVYDTLTMPPSEPVRVTSPEEAAAAQNMMREKAGSIGATGLLSEEVREELPDGVRMSRSITPIFAVSDTARAYAACRKGR